MTRSQKWVQTTIAEPFPVFYGHVNRIEGEGPFYRPNSQWYDLPENLQYRQVAAEHLRKAGYTVTVEIVER